MAIRWTPAELEEMARAGAEIEASFWVTDEVEQPESIFLIRISERGIAFIEADCGMWKLKAREVVKAHLEDKLSAEVEGGSVIIAL